MRRKFWGYAFLLVLGFFPENKAFSPFTNIDSRRTYRNSYVSIFASKEKENDVQVINLQDVTPFMHQAIILQQESGTSTMIQTTGYITHKRSFGSALAFIDIIDTNHDIHNDKDTPQPLQALLKRQEYNYDLMNNPVDDTVHFKSMIKALHPGTKIMIQGVPSTTKNPGEVVLLVKYLKIIGCSRNPEHIRGLIQRIQCDEEDTQRVLSIKDMDDDVFGPDISLAELQKVLKGESTIEDLLELKQDSKSSTQDQKGRMTQHAHSNVKIPYPKIAKLISDRLPDDDDYPSIILNSKGGVKGQSSNGKQPYTVLPKVPSDVRHVPSIIVNQKTKNIGSSFTHVSTISDALDLGDQKPIPMSISGWVQNRRRFQGENNSIAILEIVDELVEDEIEQPRLKCILHPDSFSRLFNENDVAASDAYGHLAAKGSKITLQGHILLENSDASKMDDRPILWVTDAKLDRITWAPQTVKYMLDLIANSKETGSFSFDIEEVSNALNIGHKEAIELIEQSKDGGDLSGSTERQWKASELSANLQLEGSRLGVLSEDMVTVLEDYQDLKLKYPLEEVTEAITAGDNRGIELAPIPISRRTRIASDDKDKGTLRSSTEGSRWRRKKRPQLEFMANTLKDVVEAHPSFGLRPLNILDVGGGKGSLSNYISTVFGDSVKVHVIDIDGRSIRNGLKDAERKGIGNVKYGVGDASDSNNIENLLNSKEEQFDIIVALHACGALTDIALGHAVTNAAGFVITPCCFRSNDFLNVSLKKSDRDDIQIYRPHEWLNIEEEKLFSLTSAAELQGDVKNSGDAIHTLCSLRAEAVRRHLQGTLHDSTLDISLKTFPISFSTRNYCMVGTMKKINT